MLKQYVNYIQRMHHLDLVEMNSYEDLLEANTFLQEESWKYFGYEKVPQRADLIQPKGLVGNFCIKKANAIIGTISLFDPTQISSFVSHVFSDSELVYDKENTLELGRLIMKSEAQRADSMTYLLLMYACYQRTKEYGRTQWLACSHKRVLRQTKFLGAEVEILAERAKLSRADNFQAYYFSNVELEGSADNYKAYLVKCDEQSLRKATKRYFKRKWKKFLN